MLLRKCLCLLMTLAFLMSLGALGAVALADGRGTRGMPTSESATPDAPPTTPDAPPPTPDDPTPAPESPTPESPTPESPAPESPNPESPTPVPPTTSPPTPESPTPTPEDGGWDFPGGVTEPESDPASPHLKRRGEVLIQGEDERLLVIGGPYDAIEIRDAEGNRLYWESGGETISSSLSIRTEVSQRLISLELDREYRVSVTAGGTGPLGLSLYSFSGTELLRLCALERENRVDPGDKLSLDISAEGMTVTREDQTVWPVRVLEGEEIRSLPVTSTVILDGVPREDAGLSFLCSYGEVIKLAAPGQDGMQFLGWFREGESQRLSETEELYYFVDGEVRLEARYSRDDLAHPIPNDPGVENTPGQPAKGLDLGILLPILLILLLLACVGVAVLLLLRRRRRRPEETLQVPAREPVPETIVQTEPPSLKWVRSDKKY